MVLFLRGGAQFSPRYFDDRELAYLAKYIIKRVAMGLLCIFIVATLTFLLMNLVPGGPFTAEKSMSEAAQRALEAKFGLDKPLGQRYLTYMSNNAALGACPVRILLQALSAPPHS